MLVAGLKGVDNTENLGGVAAGGGRVGQDEADSLLWVDNENGTDSERNTLRVNICGVLVVNPVCSVSSRN